MKTVLSSFVLLLMMSCGSNDDGVDCSLVDCAFQRFTIELVDELGNNLLTNGTYNNDEVTVTKNGTPLFFGSSTSEAISFQVRGEVGQNTYEIQLGETETDTLVLTLSGEDIRTGCCGPYFPITMIVYNGEELEGEIDPDFYFGKITVVK